MLEGEIAELVAASAPVSPRQAVAFRDVVLPTGREPTVTVRLGNAMVAPAFYAEERDAPLLRGLAASLQKNPRYFPKLEQLLSVLLEPELSYGELLPRLRRRFPTGL